MIYYKNDTSNPQYAGTIIYFHTPDGKPFYVYQPLNLKVKEDIEKMKYLWGFKPEKEKTKKNRRPSQHQSITFKSNHHHHHAHHGPLPPRHPAARDRQHLRPRRRSAVERDGRDRDFRGGMVEAF